MNVRMKIEKISGAVERRYHARAAVFTKLGLNTNLPHFPDGSVKKTEQRPVIQEVRPNPFRYGPYDVAMWVWQEHRLYQMLGKEEGAFCITARTETATLTGIRY